MLDTESTTNSAWDRHDSEIQDQRERSSVHTNVRHHHGQR